MSSHLPRAYLKRVPVCTTRSLIESRPIRYTSCNDMVHDGQLAALEQSENDYEEDYLVFLKNLTWDFSETIYSSLEPSSKLGPSSDAGVTAYDRYTHIFEDGDLPHSLELRALPAWWIQPRTGPQVCLVPLLHLAILVSLETTGFNAVSHHAIKVGVELVLPESVQHISLWVSVHPLTALHGKSHTGCALILVKVMRRMRDGPPYMRPPITGRLNSAVPGVNLTEEDSYNIMSLYTFHSQAVVVPSLICGLFTSEEFRGFEYFGDVDKFYDNG
ncbi:hypothetical protein BJY52DRAFT_1186478 [Lactarius psammicola]|nr:hypothetical protein BJY52DRAFT_1186478 [Lactarius psammicola]